MLDIKVLGPGCDNCKKVEALAKQAVANLGAEATIEKIVDRAEYPKYGLLYTPGSSSTTNWSAAAAFPLRRK